jgi:hypothetical protein
MGLSSGALGCAATVCQTTQSSNHGRTCTWHCNWRPERL